MAKTKTIAELRTVSRNQSESARARIAISRLVDRVQACAMGEVQMDATEFRAAALLIDKVIPNITKSEVETTVNHQHEIPEATRQLLESIAARLPRPEKVVKPVVEVESDPVLLATDFQRLGG